MRSGTPYPPPTQAPLWLPRVGDAYVTSTCDAVISQQRDVDRVEAAARAVGQLAVLQRYAREPREYAAIFAIPRKKLWASDRKRGTTSRRSAWRRGGPSRG